MFRNLRFYRISSPWPDSESALSDILADRTFSACGAFAERTSGWEAPLEYEGAPLCRRVNGCDLLQLRTQSRVLPVAAIKEAMEEKVAEYRGRMAQEPPRSELRRLREETREALLPKALLKSERTRACFMPRESLLAVDAGTDSKADEFIEALRSCFVSFRCAPLTFNEAPGNLLKRIFLGETPAGFVAGRECRMQDASDVKSIATWRGFDLTDPSIRRHVAEGMHLTHLGVEFEQTLSCVISQDGVISKFSFAGDRAAEDNESEDPAARQDADFVLLAGAAERLVVTLKKLLGGYADGTN